MIDDFETAILNFYQKVSSKIFFIRSKNIMAIKDFDIATPKNVIFNEEERKQEYKSGGTLLRG
jgi:hypothetical protein